MAGSPLKRMRRAGVTDPVTGELIPFPYMPRVAELPPSWPIGRRRRRSSI